MLALLQSKLKKGIAVTAMCLLGTFSSCAQQTSEIIWDPYGVPHIYAGSTEEMYYAFGWTQMHNHGNLLMQLYAQARGRAAEYWGAKYVASDKQVRLFNLPDSAQQQYARQPQKSKKHLDAFVKGINAYAAANPNAIAAAMKVVLPITVPDVMAHSTRIICLEFLGGSDLRIAARSVAPGSNAYAIAPSKSASKNAMLVTNPHLPWSDFFLFFEAHLTAPGFNAYGVSLVGQPVLNIAFNETLGWTHTVNTIDASDRYELTLKDGGYVLDGAVRAFDKKTVNIKVKGPDGSIKIESIEMAYSIHGPVVGKKGDKAYTVRIAGLENAGLADQYHKMAKAKNWTEFEAALKRLQNPMFNVIYADKEGNILYLFNGNIPKRSEGDFRFWDGIINGTLSKYIWKSYHAYQDLPKVFNPSTGFVQNANDPPWTSTYPVTLNPDNFPSYMAPNYMSLRSQRAVNLVKNDPSITFDELVAYKLNTGMEAADRFLDDLLAAVRKHPDTTAQKAAAVLKRWDKQTNGDSKGAVLFAHWFDQLNESMFATPWRFDQPVTTPDGLKNEKQAVGLLAKAATEVEQAYGTMDVAWGEVNRYRLHNYNLPGNGGSGEYGIFRTMYFTRAGGNRIAYHGDTYVAVTEFGDKVKARVLLSYGNASQPASKHAGDQLPLLSKKELRPALFYKSDVLQHIKRREPIVMMDKKH